MIVGYVDHELQNIAYGNVLFRTGL